MERKRELGPEDLQQPLANLLVGVDAVGTILRKAATTGWLEPLIMQRHMANRWADFGRRGGRPSGE
jgi:hypothetical protein